MKKASTQFTTGQLLRVKGKTGDFRYVKNNIVREISTGKVFSVHYSQLRDPKEEMLIVFFFKCFINYFKK